MEWIREENRAPRCSAQPAPGAQHGSGRRKGLAISERQYPAQP